MTNILWLRKIEQADYQNIGKKAYDLNSLYINGISIPAGFVITKNACQKFFAQISHRIEKQIQQTDFDNPMVVKRIASEIQKMILETPMQTDLDNEIEDAYESMNVEPKFSKALKAYDFLKHGTESEVAVRMSLISDEIELAKNSERTCFLNVTGVAQLKRAVKACWAALFSSKNISERLKRNIGNDRLQTSVIVQRMIKSDKSGIVYSKNPENGSNEIIIKSCWGLGKTLDEIKGNYYALESERNTMLRSEINPQQWAYYGVAQGKITKQELPYTKINAQVLNSKDLINLGGICRKLKTDVGGDFSFEFGIDGENAYIINIGDINDKKTNLQTEDKKKIPQNDAKIAENKFLGDSGNYLDSNNAIPSTFTGTEEKIIYGSSSPFGALVKELPVKTARERISEKIPSISELQEERSKDERVEVYYDDDNENFDINKIIEESGKQEDDSKESGAINSAYNSFEDDESKDEPDNGRTENDLSGDQNEEDSEIKKDEFDESSSQESDNFDESSDDEPNRNIEENFDESYNRESDKSSIEYNTENNTEDENNTEAKNNTEDENNTEDITENTPENIVENTEDITENIEETRHNDLSEEPREEDDMAAERIEESKEDSFDTEVTDDLKYKDPNEY